MKNLKYLEIEYFDWYQEMIKLKNENDFLIRQDSLDAVKVRYSEYVTNFNSNGLLLINDSIYPKNHIELTGCYKSKTKMVIELLSLIKNNQTLEAKSKCQYCNINKPKTIDHYLPISLFPEYAVLAINLLPCCNECNKKKDNYWKEDGIRGILNFYVDNIPNEQFLNGVIIIQNEIPLFTLKFNFSSIHSDLSNIIKAHFKRLELFQRYEEESAEEISEITRQLRIYSNGKSIKEVSFLLKKDSLDLQAKYGKNYWKAILRDALSESNEYLSNYI